MVAKVDVRFAGGPTAAALGSAATAAKVEVAREARRRERWRGDIRVFILN